MNKQLHPLHSMKTIRHLIAFAWSLAVTAGLSILPAQAISLDQGSLHLDVRADNGAIDTITFGGVDFFNPGSPVSDFGFQVGTDTTSFRCNNTDGLRQVAASAVASGSSVVATGTYTGGGANVSFIRTYSLVAGQNVVKIVTQLTNGGSSNVTLRYFDTFDPDQGMPLGGYSTVMDVFPLSTAAGSIAVGQAYSTYNNFTFLLGPAAPAAAVVSSGSPYQRIYTGTILNSVFATPADANGANQDFGVHAVFERVIPAAGSVAVELRLAFGTSPAAAQSAFVASSGAPPTVTTNPATGLTVNTATLNGTVNPNGSLTTAWFEYSLTAAYGNTTSVTLSPNNGTGAQAVSATITGLNPGTTYHCRLVATSTAGGTNGADQTFTTLPNNNADLSGLALSTGTLTPAFATATANYAVTLPYATTSLSVTPTTAMNSSTVKVNGVTVISGSASPVMPLTPGTNPITVVVTALDHITTKTYTLIVTRTLPVPGTLDVGFGTGGKVTTPIGSNAAAYSLAMQGDGKILLAGTANAKFALVRYNTDGNPDSTFNGTGIVTTTIGTGTSGGWSVAVQKDLKILVAGVANNGSGNDFALARYNPDGHPDTSFNGTGVVITPDSSGYGGRSVVVQDDGKILVAGGSSASFTLVRYMLRADLTPYEISELTS